MLVRMDSRLHMGLAGEVTYLVLQPLAQEEEGSVALRARQA